MQRIEMKKSKVCRIIDKDIYIYILACYDHTIRVEIINGRTGEKERYIHLLIR